MNNYLKPVIREKTSRKLSKKSRNRRKKASYSPKNTRGINSSYRYTGSSKYVPANRRGSTSPRLQYQNRIKSHRAVSRVDSRIQTIKDNRYVSNRSRTGSISTKRSQSPRGSNMSKISKKMMETFKLYQIGKT